MGHGSGKQDNAGDGEPSVRLQMPGQDQPIGDGSDRKLSRHWGSTVFEPQRELSGATNPDAGSSSFRSVGSPGGHGHGPEKELTLFALRLAVLEKAASGVGALGFIWATVVLLGGFAITLDKADFWVVTVILLIEGARIFTRSHELEWQHQSATWSLADAGRSSFRALRSFLLWSPTSSLHDATGKNRVPPCSSPAVAGQGRRRRWVFLSRNAVGRGLYWLQLLSAAACVSLSLSRLARQDYGDVAKGDTDRRNRKAALNLFYGAALAEAAMFLVEKAYWEWKVSFRRLLEEVNRDCGFGPSGLVAVRRFFYDAYSRCINGSVFDGLRMDFVSFASDLLASDNSRDEQLVGARILRSFVSTPRFSGETLRKVGTSAPVVERLLEMLTWEEKRKKKKKNPAEEELRLAAAEVVSKLAGKKQNALRVAAIPGAMESISSLLYNSTGAEEDGVSPFHLLGLLILKKLARDHDNCGKIGNTRGLLPKVIDFTGAGKDLLLREDPAAETQLLAVKRSLQLVKRLASTTGQTGKVLRKEISEVVFTVGNIREILQHGGRHTALQQLAVGILTSLAMDGDARESIGCTGGVARELVGIFLKAGVTVEAERWVSVEAGEAVALLAVDSAGNCERVLREEGVVGKLVAALGDAVLRVNAASVLRNMCAYAGDGSYLRLRGVAAAMPTVVTAIMVEEQKPLEVSIGLAAQIFRFTSSEEQAEGLETAGVTEGELAGRLVRTLRRYSGPLLHVPGMRRFAVELAIQMMRSSPAGTAAGWFRSLGMEAELRAVADTTTELECFSVFSGSVGLSRHRESVSSLVHAALGLLAGGYDGAVEL